MLMVTSEWFCTMLTCIGRQVELLGDHLDPADVGALAHVDLADPADRAAVRIDADVGRELIAA